MNADRLEVKYDHEFVYTPDQRERFAIEVQEIILRHLAPVQKEMKEARELIARVFPAKHLCDDPNCLGCKAQAWLARNPEGEGV